MPTAVCVEVGAALAAAAAGLRSDPQALARMVDASGEALRATLEGAGNPGIHAALAHLEAARRSLAAHVREPADAASTTSAAILLRELHQVLGELHVRLFMDASTRFELAPLIQLVRDDVSILRPQFAGGAKPADPRGVTRLLLRIRTELVAVQVLDNRSARALTEARKLLGELLDVVDDVRGAGLAPDVHDCA